MPRPTGNRFAHFRRPVRVVDQQPVNRLIALQHQDFPRGPSLAEPMPPA